MSMIARKIKFGGIFSRNNIQAAIVGIGLQFIVFPLIGKMWITISLGSSSIAKWYDSRVYLGAAKGDSQAVGFVIIEHIIYFFIFLAIAVWSHISDKRISVEREGKLLLARVEKGIDLLNGKEHEPIDMEKSRDEMEAMRAILLKSLDLSSISWLMRSVAALFFVYMALAISQAYSLSKSNSVRVEFEQEASMTAPYMTLGEERIMRSRFSSMRDRTTYNAIIVDLKAIRERRTYLSGKLVGSVKGDRAELINGLQD